MCQDIDNCISFACQMKTINLKVTIFLLWKQLEMNLEPRATCQRSEETDKDKVPFVIDENLSPQARNTGLCTDKKMEAGRLQILFFGN